MDHRDKLMRYSPPLLGEDLEPWHLQYGGEDTTTVVPTLLRLWRWLQLMQARLRQRWHRARL